MRAKTATLVGTLLLLTALAVPGAPAKTGDTTCVGTETWIEDDTGDGGALVTAPLNAYGAMDITFLKVTETGDGCTDIRFTLEVNDSDGFPLFAPDDVTYTVDIMENGTGVPDFTIEYVFGTNEGATLKADGTAVTAGATAGGTGASLTMTVAKSVFAGIPKFAGADVATTSYGGDAAAVQSELVSEDDASTTTVLLTNYGIDADDDGLPDAWEVDTFGNTDGDETTDTDDDGVTDAQEYADGTDPNDADSDDDGATDGEEKAAGTDPNDASDVPGTEEEEEDPADNATHKDEHGEDCGEPVDLEAGESYAITFHEAGECTFTSGDHELVITIEAPHNGTDGNHTDSNGTSHGGSHVVSLTEDGFDPETLHIHEGDTVVFFNDGSETASVDGEPSGGNGLDFSNFETESEYAIYAGIGTGAVLILSIIALAARWKL